MSFQRRLVIHISNLLKLLLCTENQYLISGRKVRMVISFPDLNAGVTKLQNTEPISPYN